MDLTKIIHLMTPEGWTAAATCAIALFTVVLAWVASYQARLTRQTIDLARNEFLSTHRPRIVIHSMELAFDVGQNPDRPTVGAELIYFNNGSTDAQIVEIACRITRRTFPLQSGIWAAGNPEAQQAVPANKISGGGKGHIRVKSEIDLYTERGMQEAELGKVAPNRGIVCMGLIAYSDGRGVRRETGFCRRLDAVAERWVSVDAPEYEYGY